MSKEFEKTNVHVVDPGCLIKQVYINAHIHISFLSLQKLLSKMRLHYRTCRKYIEEFGPISEATVPLPVQTPNVPESSVFIPNIPIPTPSNRYVNTVKLHHYVIDMLILPEQKLKAHRRNTMSNQHTNYTKGVTTVCSVDFNKTL